MNKEEAIAKINESDNTDFHVSTQDEHTTFLNNFKETEVSKVIKDETFKIHQFYENAITDITGQKKESNEKGSDFLKRQLSAMQTELSGSVDKISNLEKAVADKSGDERIKFLQGENEALTKKHQKVLDEYKGKFEAQESEFLRSRVMSEFDKSLMGLKFKDAIPEDVRNAMIQTVKNDLINTASYIDNRLVFLDADGQPQRDDNLNVVTPAEMMKAKLKSIVDEGRKQPGVDIQDPEVTEDKDGKKVVNLVIPDSVKTNAQLTTFLMEAGLKRGSEEYHAAYAKYSEGLTKV